MPKSHVSRFNAAEFQQAVLDWYKTHARILPWRTRGRAIPNPYHVWLSEIMLQQTTVPAVIPYFQKFIEKWPDIEALASAKDAEVMAEWAGLGYYARARNLLKCARFVSSELSGKLPNDLKSLLNLSGIGDYTAAAISAIAFGQGVTVVDGNIERIVARVFAIDTPLPQGKKSIRLMADHIFDGIEAFGKPSVRAFPQALMDIGADICSPKAPKCVFCPIQAFCQAYKTENPENYPVRAPKKQIPVRLGRVYWLQTRTGDVFLEKRDERRMLGGMVGLPTTDWDKTKNFDGKHPDFIHHFRGVRKLGDVYHVFSHFRLELEIWGAILQDTETMVGFYAVPFQVNRLSDLGFPTVFLKVAKLAARHFQKDIS